MANGYNHLLKQYGLSHKEFHEILSKTKPGNNGRILFPWYVGERTPDLPNASPVYWGFLLDDFQKPVLCRAVLEGHILNLFDGYKKMPVHANEIRLTGGLSKSDAWSQTIADIFETETVPVEGEGAALGAAIHAAWVYFKKEEGNFELEQLTNEFVKLDESKRKYPKDTDVYWKLKTAYHEISLRLRSGVGEIDPFHLMNRIK
jgi:xylulokinase